MYLRLKHSLILSDITCYYVYFKGNRFQQIIHHIYSQSFRIDFLIRKLLFIKENLRKEFKIFYLSNFIFFIKILFFPCLMWLFSLLNVRASNSVQFSFSFRMMSVAFRLVFILCFSMYMQPRSCMLVTSRTFWDTKSNPAKLKFVRLIMTYAIDLK